MQAAGRPSLPRLWGLDVSTLLASSIHVALRTVIAGSNPPLGLDAQMRATPSPCRLVPAFHRQS